MAIKTYWSGEKAIPESFHHSVDWGMTTNPNVNAAIASQKIYYDFYNNGGMNLISSAYSVTDDYHYFSELLDYLRQAGIEEMFGINVSSLKEFYDFLDKQDSDNNYYNLEKFIDEIATRLSNADMSFKLYTVYQNFDKQLLSRQYQPNAGWDSITFGLEKEYDEWIAGRLNSNFKMI